jgi:hypothetical protein
MSDFDKAWERLAAAARKAPGAADDSAPFGFSTRVAALAFEAGRPEPSAFGRLALRAALVACLLALAAVGVNYSAIKGAFADEPPAAAGDDPVSEVVNLAS